MTAKHIFRVAALSLAVIAGPALAAESDAERYAKTLADAESIVAHNGLISRQMATQASEAQILESEIAAMDATAANLDQLLARMYQEIKEFVANDLPFSDPVAGRQERMARLDRLMADPTVTKAERYRRLLEAYQIELDYGRTLETYQGKLDDGREVDFVRVGRITLLYITADRAEAGYWDRNEKRWQVEDSYKSAILKALRIASKELAPDLIEVPVPAPEEVRS